MSDLSYITLPELQTLSQMLSHYFGELQRQRESVIMVMSKEGNSFKFDFDTLLASVDKEMGNLKIKLDEINSELDLRIKVMLDLEMHVKPISKMLTDFSQAYHKFKKDQEQVSPNFIGTHSNTTNA